MLFEWECCVLFRDCLKEHRVLLNGRNYLGWKGVGGGSDENRGAMK